MIGPDNICTEPQLLFHSSGDVAQAQQHYLKAIALVHKASPHHDVVYANFAA